MGKAGWRHPQQFRTFSKALQKPQKGVNHTLGPFGGRQKKHGDLCPPNVFECIHSQILGRAPCSWIFKHKAIQISQNVNVSSLLSLQNPAESTGFPENNN